jgi:hypothetical protein
MACKYVGSLSLLRGGRRVAFFTLDLLDRVPDMEFVTDIPIAWLVANSPTRFQMKTMP